MAPTLLLWEEAGSALAKKLHKTDFFCPSTPRTSPCDRVLSCFSLSGISKLGVFQHRVLRLTVGIPLFHTAGRSPAGWVSPACGREGAAAGLPLMPHPPELGGLAHTGYLLLALPGSNWANPEVYPCPRNPVLSALPGSRPALSSGLLPDTFLCHVTQPLIKQVMKRHKSWKTKVDHSSQRHRPNLDSSE